MPNFHIYCLSPLLILVFIFLYKIIVEKPTFKGYLMVTSLSTIILSLIL